METSKTSDDLDEFRYGGIINHHKKILWEIESGNFPIFILDPTLNKKTVDITREIEN